MAGKSETRFYYRNDRNGKGEIHNAVRQDVPNEAVLLARAFFVSSFPVYIEIDENMSEVEAEVVKRKITSQSSGLGDMDSSRSIYNKTLFVTGILMLADLDVRFVERMLQGSGPELR